LGYTLRYAWKSRNTSSLALTRFDQIKRFLKLSDPNTDPEPKSPGYEKLWTAKLEPFSTLFQQACKQYLHPGRNVSIDEQLILFKGRSKHTMNIPSKEADRGFKIYCLCSENYLSCMHRKSLKSLICTKFRILALRLRWLFKSLNRYLDPTNMWFIWTISSAQLICL